MNEQQALDLLYSLSAASRMTKDDHIKCETARKVLAEAIQKLHALETRGEFDDAHKAEPASADEGG